MTIMIVIAGLLAALWECSLFFNCSRAQICKPCSPYGYHDMRIISAKRISRREDSAIRDMPELGRLYVSWDEVHTTECCVTCRHTRVITRYENYHQHRKPPPT